MTVDLVPFDELPAVIRTVGTRTIQRLSTEGRFPPFIRLTPYKPMWSRRAVDSWLSDKLRALTSADGAPPVLVEFVDGEPPQ